VHCIAMAKKNAHNVTYDMVGVFLVKKIGDG
jgi:hypothetical protein